MGIIGLLEKIRRPVILALKTAITTSLGLFFIGYIILNYEKIQFKHKIEYLNVSMPSSFDHLVELSEGAGADNQQLNKYVSFYQRFLEFFPQRAETYGMLGFCYYHLNKADAAVFSYKKAVELSPRNFWFYYNLGAIYFKKGEYIKAVTVLEKAVSCDPNAALRFINFSKFIYPSIMSGSPAYGQQSSSRIVRAYSDAYKMIVLSYSLLNNFPKMLELSNKALSLSIPAKDDFFYYGGVAAYKANDLNKAILYFENAIKLNPDFFEAKYYLSMAYGAVGKKDKQVALITTLKNKDMKGSDHLNGRKIYLKVF